MPKFFEKTPQALPQEKLLSEHAESFSQYPDPSFDYSYNPVRTLLSWHAPARPYRRKDRSYYTTVIALFVLICLIAFLMGNKLLIGVILAIVFVIYVLNFIPPEEIEYKISTQGLTIGDHFYHWQQLDSFWIEEKDGHQTLFVPTLLRFPALLMLLLDGVDTEEIKRICARFLPFHEIVPKSIFEKWTESLKKHFPLENPQH